MAGGQQPGGCGAGTLTVAGAGGFRFRLPRGVGWCRGTRALGLCRCSERDPTQEPWVQLSRVCATPSRLFLTSSPLDACRALARPVEKADRRGRIQELAKPKKPKAAWENYSRRLEWGNQETIWPLSLSALMAQPTPRIISLAKPKKIFNNNLQCRCLFFHSCGRVSEIWQCPPLMNLALPSPRILKLAEPKKYQTAYLNQRPRSSAEWPVSMAALTCEASQRVLQLARPKSVHPYFMLDRQVETQVTETARMACTSPRIQHLAQPKIRKNSLCYGLGSPESVIRPVSRSAQQAEASPRMLELAKPKAISPEYLPVRDTEWPVTKAAKHAVATPRIAELSQPCKRPTANLAQFDPDAFLVKESAKKALCSSRIQMLARPVER